MGLAYLVSTILMLIFEAWKYPRSLKISVGCKFHLILVSYAMILALAASAAVGVGLANWD